MKLEIELHVHFHGDHRETAPRWATTLHDMLSHIANTQTRNQEAVMATLEQLNEALATISTEVDKVSADTNNLLAQLANIPTGGLTPEQQAAIDSAVASATAIADRLKTIDDKVPDAG